MRIEALKYRTEDNNDIIIYVNFREGYGIKDCWTIADIHYKTSKQRNYRVFSHTFRDLYEYRHLDYDKRDEYKIKKFEDFVGKEKLQEALMAAWNLLKPDMENISVGAI